MPRSRPTRGLLVAATAVLTLATGHAAPAVAAAEPPTIAVTVVDSVTGQPVADIHVLASESYGDGYRAHADFGVTTADGTVTTPSGDDGSPALTAGTWDFSYLDDSRSRRASGNSYLDTTTNAVPISAGVNDLGRRSVDQGSTVSGTARTPSGHPLPGLGLYAESPPTDDHPEIQHEFYARTRAVTGSYRLIGLSTDQYALSYDPGAVPSGFDVHTYRPATTFAITRPGEQASLDVTARVDATPDATTVVASSPARGTARLVFTIANTYYGITDPHGVVTVTSAAGKAVGGPVPVQEVDGHGQATVTFPATSTSHVYRAYYATSADHPADLRSISRSVKVLVR